jgi:cytochrome P450
LRARADLPPGPSWPAAVQGMAYWSRPLAFLERCRSRYGGRFTLRLPMTPPFVMHTDPAHVKEIFTAPPEVLHPGRGARVLEPLVGLNSVILLDEGAHMEQRKLMLPALHGEKMARLAGLMEEVAAAEIASWPRESATELTPRFQRLTLEIILRAVFGLEADDERLAALRAPLAGQLAFGDKPISLLPPPPESVRVRSVLERVGPFAAFVRMQREADALMFDLIAERRRDHADRDDILSLLLEARHEDGSSMSDEEIRDELMTLLVAGHETTASTLGWAFALLPRHPEALRRLRDEVDGGDGDEYLTATIQETLRRRPVLPSPAPRFVMQRVEVGGRVYEPGVSLVPNSYLIHHDPSIYPDPYAFRPERFVGEQPGTYTWIPFGGGRRRCLGASFAMVEMKIVIRALLAEREVIAVGERHEAPRRRNISITPSHGTRVVLRDRLDPGTGDRLGSAHVRKRQEGEGRAADGDGREGRRDGRERAGHGHDGQRQPADHDDVPGRATGRLAGVRGAEEEGRLESRDPALG